VSTADHEFFGVGVLEAMAAGTFAILPHRLSYPELIAGPEVSAEARERCLYSSYEQMVETIVWALENRQAAILLGKELACNAQRFDWGEVAPASDALFESIL
jgi:glycosyltransferase involved in cell wall biosynthesis